MTIVKIADNLIIGTNTIDEIFSNYTDILQGLQENNQTLIKSTLLNLSKTKNC